MTVKLIHLKYLIFPDNDIGAFYKDKDGNLWVGTSTNGIYFCKPDGTIIYTYDISNGLPSNIIQAIIEDNIGNIWISSNGGISRFDRKTQKFRNYSKEDGLQGDQFFSNHSLKRVKEKYILADTMVLTPFIPTA